MAATSGIECLSLYLSIICVNELLQIQLPSLLRHNVWVLSFLEVGNYFTRRLPVPRGHSPQRASYVRSRQSRCVYYTTNRLLGKPIAHFLVTSLQPKIELYRRGSLRLVFHIETLNHRINERCLCYFHNALHLVTLERAPKVSRDTIHFFPRAFFQ